MTLDQVRAILVGIPAGESVTYEVFPHLGGFSVKVKYLGRRSKHHLLLDIESQDDKRHLKAIAAVQFRWRECLESIREVVS